jgi:hypothetical protein
MSIHKQMAGIMARIEYIGKDKENKQQGFRFRGIDDVYNALHDVMADFGVFTTSEVVSLDRSDRPTKSGGIMTFVIARIRYTFWAEDGTSVTTEVIGEGMDSGDKASNKAMAVAHKYALLQVFMVPTEDMADPDAEVSDLGELATALTSIEQAADIDALKATFAAAWASFTDSADRKRLTAAKDKRKKELAQ